MKWRVAKIVGIALAVLAAAGVVLYTYGTPQAQGAVPTTPRLIAPDPNVPLAIEIPGCRCHSEDPTVVKRHEAYRMNQCAGCHAGPVPTGAQ